MKNNLNNKMLIIFLALLMFILIPTSFATDINNTVVNEVAIDNVQTGEIQTSVEDVNYGGVIGVDNHTDKQGYIEFNNDHITVKEGQSATIVGTLYMYEEDGEGYEYYDYINVIAKYTDGNGVEHTIDDFFIGSTDEPLVLKTSELTGLTPREDPYIITFTAVEDDLYDEFKKVSDGLVPSSVYLTVVSNGTSLPDIEIPDVSNGVKIYVDTKGNDNSGNGSVDNPYATIYRALVRSEEIGPGCEIIVNKGIYDLEYSIGKSVTIRGNGNVTVVPGKISFGGFGKNVFNFTGINFVNGTDTVLRGSTSGSFEDKKNYLVLNNCNFINNKGSTAAVITYANTLITNCNFINNTATGTNGEFTGIVSARSGKIVINYTNFLNNNINNNTPLLYVGGLSGNLNYNFWGNNTKPVLNNGYKVKLENWIVLDASINSKDISVGDISEITLNFKLNNGSDLNNGMPDLNIDLTTLLGNLNPATVTVSNNSGFGKYIAINNGDEIVNIANITSLKFHVDVNAGDKIYVAVTGSDSNKGTADSPLKTIEAALAKNEALGGNKTIIIRNGLYKEYDLTINKIVTIIGESKDNTVIDASNSGQILNINSNSNIYNLTFVNGVLDDSKGGAIYIDKGNVLVDNCIFKDCVANCGGAISCEAGAAGSLSVTNSIFQNNKLIDGVDNFGSAIYSDAKLTVNNSTFTNNDAGEYYGAVCVVSDALIANSTFMKNSAGQGGAIYIDAYNTATVNVENNNFTSNNGGAIYAGTSKLTVISNNIFNSNTENAIITYGRIAANIIKNNQFMDNAIAITASSSATLTNNTMSGKNAVINFKGTAISTAVVTFLNNESVKVENGTIKLTATVTDDMGNPINGGKLNFTANNENIGEADIINGKAVLDKYFDTGDYVISGTFSGDTTAKTNTGLLRVNMKYYWFINETGYETLEEAINASGVNDIIKGIPGTYIINKKIEIGHRYMPIEPWEVIKNITITSVNDKAVTLLGGYTGIFSVDIGSNLTLKNLILTNNNSNSYYAGAIYVQYNSFVNIDNCTFVNNTATKSGAIESWGNLTITNTVFKNNKATAGVAGAIQQGGSYGKLTIINSTFEDNSASNYAGAIYSSLISGNGVNIINTKFINNNASCAGAIFINNDQVNIDNCLFIGNKAIDKGLGFKPIGGAIYDHSAPLNITNSKFINNTADENGGALSLGNTVWEYIGTDYHIIEIDWTVIENSTFENNFAGTEGGAIYNGDGVGYTNISDSKFINNFARSTGGAISNHYGFMQINTTEFIGNGATESSVMYIFGNYTVLRTYLANTTIVNSKFVNNIGKNLFKTENKYCNLNITDSTFKEPGLLVNNAGYAVLINNTVENIREGLVVRNVNTLTLANNSFNCIGPAISNTKYILSETYVIILNNKTVTCEAGKMIKLTAVHVDDSNNIIIPGKVTFNVDNMDINATLNDNGVFSANCTLNAIGEYIVSAIYKNIYAEKITYLNGTVIIVKTSPSVNVTFNNESIFGEDINVKFEINGDATGNVTFAIGNITKTAAVVNGKADATLSGVTPGNHTLTVYYSGDNKYDSLNNEYNVSVVKSTVANLTVKDLEKYFGGSEKLEAVLTDYLGNPIVNGTVIFNINGKDYVKYTNENGSAFMSINLVPGKYNITVKFNGTKDYDAAAVNATVTVKSTVIGNDIVKMFRNGTQYSALFLDSNGNPLANTTVKFNINGVFYTKSTNDKGIATLNIQLLPKEYIITNYNLVTGEENSNKVTVKSLLVDNSDLVKYYLNESNYTLKVIGKDGKVAAGQEVTFNINGVFYQRVSDDNGVVSLGIKLRPGTYIVTAEYEGCWVSNNITVLPTLITKDLDMKYLDGSNFTAQTLDGQGKALAKQNISFNVNGVFYHKTTDENGITNLNIRLNPGKYIITSIWNEYQVGNNITIK
ncbi:beta strand repeat-containing protein [Methanobrevibacter intestini]|uniref:beta strand repeat-containing protein n=1 Tax=Methanobrevibacter intestini TaxID=2911853 RepID=UPI003D067B26